MLIADLLRSRKVERHNPEGKWKRLVITVIEESLSYVGPSNRNSFKVAVKREYVMTHMESGAIYILRYWEGEGYYEYLLDTTGMDIVRYEIKTLKLEDLNRIVGDYEGRDKLLWGH